MNPIHLPQQRPASGPAPVTGPPVAAPAGDPGWSRVLLVAGSRAALAVVLSLVVWSVLPAALGWSPRVIMSGSMEPRIHVGDVVVDRPVDPSTLEEGRIVTVTDPDHPEKTRTHRLQEWNDSGQVVTKGDANDAADSTPVDPGDILGVAAVRVPYVGLPVTWLSQGQLAPVGITVTLLVLLGLAATTPLRLAGPGAGTDEQSGDDDTGGPDDTDGDAGLGILDPAAAARRRDRTRADAPRRGGRVATRSTGRRARRIGVAGAALGAVLATFATTGTTYAAFAATTENPANVFSTAAVFSTYEALVRGDAPQIYWRLNEAAGSDVAADASGNGRAGSTVGSVAFGKAGALLDEQYAAAAGFDGGGINSAGTAAVSQNFSVELWVRTTSTAGGPLLALTASTNNGVIERALYVGTDGVVRFGRSAALRATGSKINDGAWHHVVYTNSSTGTPTNQRAKLYVDGRQVGTGSAVTQTVTGYWDAAQATFTGSWTGNPSSAFRGDLDEIAVYTDVLTPTEVAEHYTESGR